MMQWRIQGGGKRGASVPPFGLHPTVRSTDDKLNGTPLSGYTAKNTTAMAYRFRRKFVRKKIDWTGRAGSEVSKRSKWVWPKVGVAYEISRALCAQEYTTTPL